MAPLPSTALIVLVMATLSHPGGRCQSPPSVTSDPPFETPPPPTTVPPGCRRDDGTVVEGMLPGDSRQTGCEFCECDQQGLVVCAYGDCIMPPCVDPLEGDCCSTCPNGNNCRTPSGQIIGDGETVTEGDMICTCSTQDYFIWDDGTQEGDGPQAKCIPRSTTTTTATTTTTTTTSSPPPPACRLDNGTVMKGLHPQGHWRSADGCRSCYCEVNGRAYCNVTECSAPACERPVSTAGVCCLGCPDQGAHNQPDPGKDGLDGNTADNAGAPLPPLGHSLCLSLACTLLQLLPFFKFVFDFSISSETVCIVADITER